MSTSVWQWGQCDWRHFIDKTEVSFYFYKPRQDGPCDFQVSREALTLELSWERTPGFLHFQPVFQRNMLMLWAVSFQIPIKAALDVGDCRGRSIRWGSFACLLTRDFVKDNIPSLWWTSCSLPNANCAISGSNEMLLGFFFFFNQSND